MAEHSANERAHAHADQFEFDGLGHERYEDGCDHGGNHGADEHDEGAHHGHGGHEHASTHDGCRCGHDHSAHKHEYEHAHEHDHRQGHNHAHEQDHEHEGCHCAHNHGDHHHDHDACGHDHHHDHDGCHHDHCGCDHDDGHDHCGCDCCHDHEDLPTRELSDKPSFSYHVLGMDCPSCALGVQRAVCTLDCVADARLVYATATLEVVAASGADLTSCKREVLATVRSCGEDLELSDEEKAKLEAGRSWFAENREQVLMGLSGLMLVAGLTTEHLVGNEAHAHVFYVIAALAGLVFVAPMALAALRRRTADMNVLMGIAVIGALIIGFGGDPSVFCDAAIVIFLDQIGEWLEGWSMRKTSGSVRELMDLAPSVAHVVTPEGATVNVQTKGVSEGYVIRVLPGERVPLDGCIVEGSSSFNEAPVTGESLPQDKGVGAEVFAGSLNTGSVVDVQVTADEDCSTLARIVSQVQGAQAQKAPYESFVDRFAAAYTPVVVVGALILGVCVPLVLSFVQGGRDTAGLWHDWVYRACSLLVVACPCALVISTPVSFVSALSCAARHGVLVKGGACFDAATHVDTVAFDKTGTLTTGDPVVTEVVPFGAATINDVLSVAAALESGSTHPLARAIVQAAEQHHVRPVEARNLVEIAAHGMRGSVGGTTCVAGKIGYARELGHVQQEVTDVVDRLGQAGATAVVLMRGAQVLGVIGVADDLRPSAAPAVAELKAGRRPRSVEMLTGDNVPTAMAAAARLDVEDVSAELLPGGKLERVKELQREGCVVAMVGDGINDAPALAQADLGITMGAAASDTALEVADVSLLSDGLEQLPLFFSLAQRTMNVVRENIALAIGIKVLVFVLVIAGAAGMGAAVFADTGVALIVVLNGMRLMRPSRLRW